MKKSVFLFASAIILFSSISLAEPITVDLDAMTPAEIKELITLAEAEYKEATSFSSDVYTLLAPNFRSAFESLIPSDATASYPLLGFKDQRARTMYMLSGNCTVKFADKSKSSYEMTMIYWHDESSQTFHQVAFFSDEKIYYCDNELLKNVVPYLNESIIQKLGANDIIYQATTAQATPVPTPTSTPTPTHTPAATPSPDPTLTATPAPTPEPTSLTPEALIEQAIRAELGEDYIRHEIHSYTANCNIYFHLGSGWDNASIRSGFLYDCAQVLQKLDELNDSGAILLDSIYLQADGEFIDTYGNATTEKAIALRIYKETLEKINWDRFNYKDLDAISYSYWCHPALKD
ncbi:MAG: hypothetical protein IKK34_08390 [Clostridia bacterium]|nr:hypothetical protein [Clostridia bacterium]